MQERSLNVVHGMSVKRESKKEKATALPQGHPLEKNKSGQISN
jgi:hypothetical protein